MSSPLFGLLWGHIRSSLRSRLCSQSFFLLLAVSPSRLVIRIVPLKVVIPDVGNGH